MGEAPTTEEIRLTKVENEISHLTHTVGQLSGIIENGFKEFRKIIQEQATQFDQRTSKVHERIDEHTQESLQNRIINPSVVIAIIIAVIAVGSVGVAFVRMSITPMELQAKIEREWLYKYTALQDAHINEKVEWYHNEKKAP